MNVEKTKEIIVDFRRKQPTHTPLYIDGTAVELQRTWGKFLGVHMSKDLTWSKYTSFLTRKDVY